MQKLAGNILTPDGWHAGEVSFDARIGQIVASPASPADNALDYLIPGFIDLHVHGGGGRDVMEGGDALRDITRTHARHGTTSLLATTMTAPAAEIEHAMAGIQAAVAQRAAGGARVLGTHLEGPYINPGKLGAQPDTARRAALVEVERLLAIAPIRVLTMAPEMRGHLAMVRDLVARDIRVQIGHSLGSYADGVAALEHGAISFTHLFNAMTGMHHREPGLAGAALAHAEYAEIIPDLVHVHPGAILAALRAIPKLYCVSDSTAAAGMPDGEYRLGRHQVTKCMGGVRLPDGTLAGSALTLDDALRNLVSLGLDLADASRRLSAIPAEVLGLTDRGQLTPGAYADIVVLDRTLRLRAVYIEGERVEVLR